MNKIYFRFVLLIHKKFVQKLSIVDFFQRKLVIINVPRDGKKTQIVVVPKCSKVHWMVDMWTFVGLKMWKYVVSKKILDFD